MPLSTFRPDQYHALLTAKVNAALPGFRELYRGEVDIVHSPAEHFRMRAEFRMWHADGRIEFAMFRPQAPRQPVFLTDFPIASRHISERMPALKAALDADPLLRGKLFQVEFLTTSGDDTLLTLIYHRPLDERWDEAASRLQTALGLKIIGRSRRQRRVLSDDFVTEVVQLDGRRYRYRQAEGAFTQPNGAVNQRMVQWVLDHSPRSDGDLLELYCGIGNFTLPLASRFRQVLATEISKQAVACARHNLATNGIDNVRLLRMSSEEFGHALDRVRPYRRLAEVDLDALRLQTALVDPPRAGLDPATLQVIRGCGRIIYISCNPVILLENLHTLASSHHLTALAFFDQFPYTPHLECGVILQRNPAAP